MSEVRPHPGEPGLPPDLTTEDAWAIVNRVFDDDGWDGDSDHAITYLRSLRAGPMPRRIVVRLSLAEAERLYASAALYETSCRRIVNQEANDVLAQSALTKLADAIWNPEP